MTQESINRLLTGHLKTILGFALTRLGDYSKAEELASDITVNLLRALPNLRDESKFYPFLWRVCENTWHNYLRCQSRHPTEPLPEDLTDERCVEDDLLAREELMQLRRELSLLTGQCRQATVLYYMEGLSCHEIADRLSISTEMVKYYLFRARKILREGMNMERIFGEKSYNPQPFEIDFWGTHGGDDSEYRAFSERKLPGNILLAAYYTPITAQELSLEFGVAMPYLEDELALLTKRSYLTEKNGRYRTGIPIVTDEIQTESDKKIRARTYEALGELFPALQESDRAFAEAFGQRFDGESSRRWQLLTLFSHFALSESPEPDDELPADTPYRLMVSGGRGYIWGRSVRDEARKFNGIYFDFTAGDGRSTVTAINFAQLNQHFQRNHLDPVSCIAVGCAACLSKEMRESYEQKGYTRNGKPTFAVWTEAEMGEIRSLLNPVLPVFSTILQESAAIAAAVFADHAPAAIRQTAVRLSKIISQHDGLWYIADVLLKEAWLERTDGCPCLFAVRHGETD